LSQDIQLKPSKVVMKQKLNEDSNRIILLNVVLQQADTAIEHWHQNCCKSMRIIFYKQCY